MTKIDYIFEREAFILNACPDVSTSFFKRPLDSRIFAIKDIRDIDCDLVLKNTSFAILLADKEGKQNGKYVVVDCSLECLELFINNFLLPDLD